MYFYESKDERREIIVQVKGGGVKRGDVANRNAGCHLSAEAIWTACIDHCPGRFGVEDF